MLQLEITNTGEYVSLKHEGDKVLVFEKVNQFIFSISIQLNHLLIIELGLNYQDL